MKSDRAANLLTLVELLRASAPVAWEEAEALIADFPGWLDYVRMVRYSVKNSNMRVVAIEEASQFTYLSAVKRQHLLDFFLPYAILLDDNRTPAERVVSLRQDADINVKEFCRECLHNADPAISQAAREVLDACLADATLLRGATKPGDPPDQLLRLPTGLSDSAANLLRPLVAVSAGDPAPPRKLSWLRRLFARRKSNPK